MRHLSNCSWLYILLLMLMAVAGTVYGQQDPPVTATVLLTDISSSMASEDASGIVKLDAAKTATRAFLTALENDPQSGLVQRQDYVSQLAFCEDARQYQSFITNLSLVRDAVDDLVVCGSTNMYDGINLTTQRLANFQATQPIDQSLVIMLSDGVPTASSISSTNNTATLQQEVLGVLPQLGAVGACLHIIPLGNPNASPNDESFVDLNFLEQMVNAVGCGSVLPPSQSRDLIRRYIRVWLQEDNNEIIIDETVVIPPNQPALEATFPIPPNTDQLRLDIVWQVGQAVDFVLTDPDGIIIDENYPNTSITKQDGQLRIIVTNPKAGDYGIKPINRSNQTVAVDTLVSRLPGTGAIVNNTMITDPAGTNLMMILLAALTGAGVAGVILLNANRAHTVTAPGNGSLMILSGMMSGQSIPIIADPFTIGRNRGCNLQIMQSDVSRQHAQIYFENGTYILQDLNSKLGTYVNGHAIHRHALRPGDNIRIGDINIRVNFGSG